MESFAVAACVAVCAVAMSTDWWAVRGGHTRAEFVAKPAVMLGLIALVAVADPIPSSLRPWLLLGLVLGLAGDVLLLPQVDRFVFGLGAFLFGHLAYIVAMSIIWSTSPLLVVGALGAIALMALFGRGVISGAWGTPLAAPVIAYILVTMAIIVVGSGTGRWLIAGGALAFATSDGLLGSDRFVRPAPDRRVWVHVLYHLGQAAIVAGALTEV